MHLSKVVLAQISPENVDKAEETLLSLPEKVLQFGTGVLLRGLPDYFIDKANRQGIFNGRVVVVKSTDSGDTNAFDEQDGLYTLCIRGLSDGNKVEENIICSSISRVLSAKQQWADVLLCAHNPDIKIVISNTTEVGIQLTKESILQKPPVSFPAKLLAFLYERYKVLGPQSSAGMVIIPTELITDNGKKLQSILNKLIEYDNLEQEFGDWFNTHNHFCNSLVDCIVPGKPADNVYQQIQSDIGYTDKLLTVSEPYRLWAIEGDETIASALSFAQADTRIIITPDIEKYKELKLRILNGTHTLSCGLAYLSGVATVKEAMADRTLSAFILNLMLKEIVPAIPYPLQANEANDFALQVLDRFRNPYIQHQWLSITMQYTSKLAMRAIPVLLRYYEMNKSIPQHFALGFAAYLLFMKVIKKDGDKYYGERDGQSYLVNDDQAPYYFLLWQKYPAEDVVSIVLKNTALWQTDLQQLEGFEARVRGKLSSLISQGSRQTLNAVIAD